MVSHRRENYNLQANDLSVLEVFFFSPGTWLGKVEDSEVMKKKKDAFYVLKNLTRN